MQWFALDHGSSATFCIQRPRGELPGDSFTHSVLMRYSLSLEQVYDIFKDGYGTDTYPGKRWKKTTRPDSQFELEGRINCET